MSRIVLGHVDGTGFLGLGPQERAHAQARREHERTEMRRSSQLAKLRHDMELMRTKAEMAKLKAEMAEAMPTPTPTPIAVPEPTAPSAKTRAMGREIAQLEEIAKLEGLLGESEDEPIWLGRVNVGGDGDLIDLADPSVLPVFVSAHDQGHRLPEDQSGVFFLIPLLGAGAKAIGKAAKNLGKAGKARRKAARAARKAARKAASARKQVELAKTAPTPVASETSTMEARAKAAEAERAKLQAELELMREKERIAKETLQAEKEVAKMRKEIKRDVVKVHRGARKVKKVSSSLEAQRQRHAAKKLKETEARAGAVWRRAIGGGKAVWGGDPGATARAQNLGDSQARLAHMQQLGLAPRGEDPSAYGLVHVGRVDSADTSGALFIDTDGYRHQHGPLAD